MLWDTEGSCKRVDHFSRTIAERWALLAPFNRALMVRNGGFRV